MPPRLAKLAMVNLEGKDQHFLLESVESLLADKGIRVESGVAQTDEKAGLFYFFRTTRVSPFI